MDPKRLILFVIFSFSIMMLWESWQSSHKPQEAVGQAQEVAGSASSVPQPAATAAQPAAVSETGFSLQKGERIRVQTDLMAAEIDTMGGDIRRLELRTHHDKETRKRISCCSTTVRCLPCMWPNPG